MLISHSLDMRRDVHYDKFSNVIHIIDNNQQHGDLNLNEQLVKSIHRQLGLIGVPDYYIWYIYKLNGRILQFDLNGPRFTEVTKKDPLIYQTFVQMIQSRLEVATE